MVPSPHYSQAPYFSGCVNWILENQLEDGSWGLPQQSVRLLKDDLSSSLACILALKRWNVGEEQIKKGICFSFSIISQLNVFYQRYHNSIGFLL